MKWQDIPARLRERFIENPTDYRQPRTVGSLPVPERKCSAEPALVGESPGKEARAVSIVVCIVRFGRRILDDDNLAGGNKPLRDCIAERLGIDDGDERVEWEYRQVVTRGVIGTLVTIQMRE